MSFNEISLKITFTAVQDDLLLLFHQSNINRELGFPELYGAESGEALDSVGDTLTSTGVVNMASIHSFMLKSNIATSNVLSTRQGSSSTLQKISIDRNSNGIVYLNAQDFRQITISQTPQIDQIEFRLSDQNDRTVQLNNVNFEFTLLFQIYPRYDRVVTGSRGRRASSDEVRVVNTPQPIQRVPQAPQFIERMDTDEEPPVEGVTETSHGVKRLVLDQLLDTISKST
jgi:hypothetical protein